MCACINKKQYKFRIVLLPHKQPIGLYMALPTTGIVSCQFVLLIFGRKLIARFLQQIDHLCQTPHIIAPFNTKFYGFLKLIRSNNFILAHNVIPNFSNISLELL